MVFVSLTESKLPMTRSNTNSSGTTVLVVLLIIFTFPIWIGILGGLFGIVIGICGAVIGVIAGVFGAIVGGVASLFGGLFHWGWSDHNFFWNVLLATILAFAIVQLAKSRNKK